MIATIEESEGERIASLLEMVWRKAPVFLRSGDLIDDQPEQCNPCKPLAPAKREEILRLFSAQRAAGAVSLKQIALVAGVSLNCVVVHTRAMRRNAV